MTERVVVPGRRLGRNAPPPEKRTHALEMARYIAPLPTAPAALDLRAGIPSWPMFLNDRLGDCVIAACAHEREVLTRAASGTAQVVTDADVLAFYETQGYNPADPATDQGCDEMSVMNTWRKQGFAGESLYAYASVDVTNLPLVRTAAWLFYGLILAIELPLIAQSQDVWDAVPGPLSQIEPGGWGGHGVSLCGYDAGGFTVVTWGATKRMTVAFWQTYVDEAWALIPQDFEQLGTKPLDNGFNAAQLNADLLSVGAVDEGN